MYVSNWLIVTEYFSTEINPLPYPFQRILKMILDAQKELAEDKKAVAEAKKTLDKTEKDLKSLKDD